MKSAPERPHPLLAGFAEAVRGAVSKPWWGNTVLGND